tara:strand:+ start:980 stop:5179 length:4200 start_codon:yes stop_codon:yes gene_type:complete
MFPPTSEIINKDLEKKSTTAYQFASLEEIQNLNSYELPKISNDNPAVILDYNKKTDQVKVGYMEPLVNDNDLVDVASDFYFYRDGVKFDTPEETIKYWMSDRTWKQTNTVSMTKELMFVTEDDQNLKQLANLKYLTEKWNTQPMFFRGAFETTYENVKKAIVDPLNLVGGIFYGQFAKKAGQKAFSKILEKQIQKQLKKKVTLGVSTIKAAEAANKAKLIGAVKGGLKVAGIDAALMGTADFVIQNTEKQLGMRDAYDPLRLGFAAVTGGILSFGSTAGIAYGISRLTGGTKSKLPKSIRQDLPKVSEYPDNIKINVENSMLEQVKPRGVATKIHDNYQLYGFNKLHGVDNLQKIGTGVGADVFSLKRAIKNQKLNDPDPALLPAFRFRDTLASAARAKQFIEWKGFSPAKKDAISGSYIDTDVRGLNVILKPYADLDEASDFMVYAGAKRAMDIYNYLAKQGVDLKKIQLPFSKELARKLIDYGELTPQAYTKKYGEESLKKGGNYKFGLQTGLKKFTDFLIDYSDASDLLTAEARRNILNVYKNGYVPYNVPREAAGVFKQTSKLLQKSTKTKDGVVTPSVPVKKLLEGTKFVDLDFYSSLINYTHKVVQGADFNRANLSLVDMLTDLQNSKKFGTVMGDTGVLKKLSNNVVSSKAITESVQKSFNKLGLKLTKQPGTKVTKLPTSIDVATFAPVTKQAGIDGPVLTVYRKGVAEFYEIRNPLLKAMYETYGGVRVTDTLTKYSENWVVNLLAKTLNIPARILGRAITLDPLFQTANIQRDTLSGFINSAFSGVIEPKSIGKQVLKRGTLPIVDTALGLGLQIPGGKNLSARLMGVKTILDAQEAFRLAIVNGMGMSTRAETGLLIPPNLAAKINKLNPDSAQSYLDDLKATLGKGGRSVFDRYAEFVSKFEYATRMGEFAMAKKAGWSNVAASYAGREVATDFGLHGASSKLNWLSSNTIFLNAGLQGFNRGFRRMFIESGKIPGQKGITNDARAKAAALVMATVVGPKIYSYFNNRQYREYDEEKDIFKQLNIMVPSLYQEGDDIPINKKIGDVKRFLKFPMPYDYGIFGNIAEATFEYFDKNSSPEAFKYLTESFFLLMPFNTSTVFPVPTTLEFVIEALLNKDLFTGADIKQEYLNFKSSNLHITPRTRDVSIIISNHLAFLSSFGKDPDKVMDRKLLGFLPTDPITIDFLLNNFMVGIYKYPLEAFEVLAKDVDKYGPKETYKKDELDILREPQNILIKRNIHELPAGSTTHTEIFFELIARANKVLSEAPEKADITDGYKLFDKFVEGYYSGKVKQGGKEIELYRVLSLQLNIVKKNLDKIRDKMELIKMDTFLTADQKREQLDDAQQQVNDYTYGIITMIADSNLKELLENIHNNSIFKTSFTPNPYIKN